MFLQFDGLFQFSVFYDLWLFAEERHETQHIAPDVINGCDTRQTDVADNR